MAMVYLICGKICSGKSRFAQLLRAEENAVILSTDEITLALPRHAIRDCFDMVSDGVNNYLLEKSLEIIEAGVSVILDWGFWSRQDRDNVRSFYESHHVSYRFYYLDTDSITLALNVADRNSAVERGETRAFFVDEGLAAKCDALFEEPAADESIISVANRRV